MPTCLHETIRIPFRNTEPPRRQLRLRRLQTISNNPWRVDPTGRSVRPTRPRSCPNTHPVLRRPLGSGLADRSCGVRREEPWPLSSRHSPNPQAERSQRRSVSFPTTRAASRSEAVLPGCGTGSRLGPRSFVLLPAQSIRRPHAKTTPGSETSNWRRSFPQALQNCECPEEAISIASQQI